MIGSPVVAMPDAPDVEKIERPAKLPAEETKPSLDEPWHVILFNDDIHTFDEVIGQLIKATGCSRGRAEDLAWTVHTRGKAEVFSGSFEECLRVEGVLGEIGLVTEIRG